MSLGFKTLPRVMALLAVAGCTAGQGVNQVVPSRVVPPAGRSGGSAVLHLGRPYDVVPGDSLLMVFVYRGGALAKAGHNHLIASHDLVGTLYVPAALRQTTFEIRVPVGGFSVDEAALRAREGADFAAEVPATAREGTRRNMLGESLLAAGRYAQVVIRSVRLDGGPGIGADVCGEVAAQLQIEVRGVAHEVLAPVHYELGPGKLIASGELPLRQTDLGLTPFSALLGALQVQDEIRVRFRIVARAAPLSTGAAPR